MRSFHGMRPGTRRPALTVPGRALLPGLAVALAVTACTSSPGTSTAPSGSVSVASSGSVAPSGSGSVAPSGSGSVAPSGSVPVASSSAAAAAVPAGGASPASTGDSAGPAAGDPAASCTGAPLKTQLATAVRAGASLIVATGTPTGRSVTGNPATAGAPAFYAMTLTSVQTLRGPAVASGSTAWVQGPGHGTPATPVNSALLAPGGRLFAITWPKAATRELVGPVLQLAPVVGAEVVFTPYVCWNLTGLVPDQYQASTPLRPVPGGANYGGTHQAAENGLYTVPLATVRQVAASA